MKKSGYGGQGAARRSQADRSAETRARILAAAVGCVDELGFSRATFQRIARRAGVTVGAVQHHFASKEDVLRGVLEASFEHLSRCFEGVSVEGASLEERVAIFIDRAWLHCGAPPFRSTLEILMTTRGDGGEGGESWTDVPLVESTQRVQRLWTSIFSDVEIPAGCHLEMLRFAFAALAGIAMTVRLERSQTGMDRQLDLLKTSLVTLLGRAEAESHRASLRERSAVLRKGSP